MFIRFNDYRSLNEWYIFLMVSVALPGIYYFDILDEQVTYDKEIELPVLY